MAGSSGIRAGRAFVEIFVDRRALIRGLKGARRRLQGFASSVGTIGRQLTALGSIAATPFILSAGIFSSFQQKMSEVRAVTGAAGKDFDRLTAKAKELGKTTSFSAREVADGMKFLGQAGFSTEQILAGIPAVLDLAKAGAIDLGQAADIASNVGSAFGIAADDISRVADVMAVTASSANTSIEAMGESFKFAAPLAAAAGQSIEETAAAIGVLGNSGIKGTSAGTDLALILKKLADPAASRALENLGVATTDAAGKIRPVSDVMRDLGLRLKSLTPKEQLGQLATIFGRAAKSASILTSNTRGFDDLKAKIDQSAGAASLMAKIMGDNVVGDLKSFLSAVESAAIAVGEALAPSLRKILQSFTFFTRAISQFIQKNREFALTVAKVIGVVLAIGAALIALSAIVSVVGFAFGGVAAIIGGIAAVFSTLATIIGALLSPIGLVVAALVGIAAVGVGVFLKMSGAGALAIDFLRDKFAQLKAFAGETFGAIATALQAGDLQAAAGVLWASINLIWTKGTTAIKEVFIAAKETMAGAWQSFTTGIATKLLQGTALIKKGWIETRDFFLDTWTLAMTGIKTAFFGTIGAIQKAFERFKSFISGSTLSPNTLTAIDAKTQKNIGAGSGLGAITKRDQQRQKDLAAIDQQQAAAISALEDDASRKRRQRAQQTTAEITAAEKQLDSARQKWQKSIDAARSARKESVKQGATAPDKLQKLKDQFAGLGTVMSVTEKRTTSTAGTFSALAAVRSLGSQRPAERTAKATEATAENTKRIEKGIRDALASGAGVFA